MDREKRLLLLYLGMTILTGGSNLIEGCASISERAPKTPTKIAPPPTPSSTPNQPRFTDLECQKISNELRQWKLANGRFITDVVTEAKEAATELAGLLDPRVYLPMDIPIHLHANSPLPDAQLSLAYHDTPEDSRKIDITLPLKKSFRYDWCNITTATIELPSEIYTHPGARMVIAAKEISSIYYYPGFWKIYSELLAEKGISYKIINPQNLPTTPQEEVFNLSKSFLYLERDAPSNYFYQGLIDLGSGLLSGGILFANLYLDSLNKKTPLPQSKWVDAGHQYAGFLQEKGLIKQQTGSFVWTKGLRPTIDREFLNLYREFSRLDSPQLAE